MVDRLFRLGWHASYIIVIVIVLAIMYTVALYSGIREKRDFKGKKCTQSGLGFFLGGKASLCYRKACNYYVYNS